MALNKINWFRHLIGLIGFGTLFALGSLAHYLGAFKEVKLSESEKGPYYVLYQEHRGPYHKIVGVIERVETWAKTQQIPCDWTYGEYLDDPDATEESRLRSRGGCILTENFQQKLPEGFKLEILPRRHYVIAEFKGSPGIGPLKVYPKLNNYLEDHRLSRSGPILEIYKIENPEKNQMTTTYLAPIKR